ncbi:hypothetical protein [Microvirga puerhi]|uniref:Uncharacterized protein n=1 Tax=Microvirga puerhi TaxID=2876078 RepID=A0ABS7VL26_9HYPH|nr:hypothetical protein [Microvirga puerhi]MBZ6076236.1 hypothetical protein [Microvirga puerhi]
MTKQMTERDRQSQQLSGRQPYPAFKPVALPALAAAVQAANLRPTPPRQHELPAILRKEAMTD